ncbi:MAG: superoxide dismutase [Bacteroidales bacterium]|nr:superoxide dismutase [Bacteroidales bacterium]
MERSVTKFELTPLPYGYDALEKAIDKETMEIHYNRHYKGYYNNFLKAIDDTDLKYMTLEEIFAKMDSYPTAVRNNAGGYYNHSLYWLIMSPDGGGQPEGKLAEAMNSTFGSFDDFKTTFAKAGATRFGSGWAWLSVDENGKLFVSSSANQDNPLMNTEDKQGTPILGMDVWEHAYYLRYQNKRGSYIDSFWTVVNWDEVARRYEAALKMKK